VSSQFRVSLALVCLFLFVDCNGGEGERNSLDVDPPGLASATPTALAAGPEEALTAFRYRLVVNVTDVDAPPPGAGAASGNVMVTTEGAVTEGGHHASTAVDVGFGIIRSERIAIGARTWTRDGENLWTEQRASIPASQLILGLDPSRLRGADATMLLRRAVRSLPSAEDRTNEIETLRCELPAVQLQTLLTTDAAHSTIPRLVGSSTLWVTRDELFPLRLHFEGMNSQGVVVRALLELADHNSREVVVVPPQVGG
jgi:hypothetical protein